jgi:transcriptional regulator with GAF, ATPase, and Fis domain
VEVSSALGLARREAPDLVVLDVPFDSATEDAEVGTRISRELGIPVVYFLDPPGDGSFDCERIGEPFAVLVKPAIPQVVETVIRVALRRAARERRLRTSEGLMSTVFQAFPSPMLVVEADATVTLCNLKARNTFGVECDDGRPRPLEQVIRCSKRSADDLCSCPVPCDKCELIQIVREAIAGEPVEDRRCEVGLQLGETVARVVLAVSAVGFEHDGDTRAILILEDRTEFERLRQLYTREHSFGGIVGRSDAMRQVFRTIREVAEVEMPVLIQGETGTGKELVARAIHDHSARSRRAFVPVNCGAIPEGLLESELFGHVKGAFTGAVRDRQGRFTLADGGTIFLDEIGDLSPSVQVKLLRVLQEGTYEPVGAERTLKSDVRVVSATNKDLAAEVAAGRFRKDLYYRLCVLPIELPPLRERRPDIPLIADHLLARAAIADHSSPVALSSGALGVLLDHAWTGNVRELDNVLQFARMKCRGGSIRVADLPPSLRAANQPSTPGPSGQPREPSTPGRRPLTREVVIGAIERAGGNRTRAAELLGVSRATFYRFLKTLDSGLPG